MWSENGWIELKGNSDVRKYGGMKPKHLVVNDFINESKHYCDNLLNFVAFLGVASLFVREVENRKSEVDNRKVR